MHATDIIAWTYDGAIYCTNHTPITDSVGEPSNLAPVFGDQVNEISGDVCDICGEPIVEPEGSDDAISDYGDYHHTFDRSHTLQTDEGEHIYGCKIVWNGSATFNVYTLNVDGSTGHNYDAFTRYDVTSESEALAAMRDYVRDHRAQF